MRDVFWYLLKITFQGIGASLKIFPRSTDGRKFTATSAAGITRPNEIAFDLRSQKTSRRPPNYQIFKMRRLSSQDGGI